MVKCWSQNLDNSLPEKLEYVGTVPTALTVELCSLQIVKMKLMYWNQALRLSGLVLGTLQNYIKTNFNIILLLCNSALGNRKQLQYRNCNSEMSGMKAKFAEGIQNIIKFFEFSMNL